MLYFKQEIECDLQNADERIKEIKSKTADIVDAIKNKYKQNDKYEPDKSDSLEKEIVTLLFFSENDSELCFKGFVKEDDIVVFFTKIGYDEEQIIEALKHLQNAGFHVKRSWDNEDKQCYKTVSTRRVNDGKERILNFQKEK